MRKGWNFKAKDSSKLPDCMCRKGFWGGSCKRRGASVYVGDIFQLVWGNPSGENSLEFWR